MTDFSDAKIKEYEAFIRMMLLNPRRYRYFAKSMDDGVQEVLFRFYKSAKDQELDSWKAYLSKIVNYYASEVQRKYHDKIQPTYSVGNIEQFDKDNPTSSSVVLKIQKALAADFNQDIDMATIRDCLELLDDQERASFLLNFVEEIPLRELVDIIGLSYGTIRTRRISGKDKMTDCLTGEA